MGDVMIRGQRLVLLMEGTGDQSRAAWFELVHAADLAAAAGAGGLRLVEVGAAALRGLDPNLAAGQMIGPGKPSPLPLVRRSTYDALIALPPVLVPPKQMATEMATLRRSAPKSVRFPSRTIKVSSIVLASVAADDGWWEAEVVAIEPGNVLRLRWRDSPGLDLFSKPIGAIAFLEPK
jgi:hypothetical protein